MAPISLGSFDLDHPIGRGGMGVVWRATHRALGVPVAVKVLTAAGARDPGFVSAFGSEVRAVAALDHPRIIHLHDYGEVDAEAERASDGALRRGSPWLAMDLLDGGTLADRSGMGWPELRGVLLALLDALAHAHARGIVHRDIKPENVLLGDAADPAGTAQLADFGLAQAGEERAESDERGDITGTPLYMSPEQFDGRWRDCGPWTDLYALGCIAFRMASGTQPFQGSSMFALAFAHTQGRREPFRPRTPVPAGLEGWLGRLLRPAPEQRFQRAADAAWALRGLGPPSPVTERPRSPEEEELPTLIAPAALADTLASLRPTIPRPRPPGEAPTALVRSSGCTEGRPPRPPGEAPTALQVGEAPPALYPPLPASWRPRHRGGAGGLPGVGLGLFGLRLMPLIGRERERDLLWAALSEARETRGARMVLLRGGAGSGKSRLAAWLARRAAEVGSGIVLTARHSPLGGRSDGLGPMLRRHLRARGLDRGALLARTTALLGEAGEGDDYEQLGLTEIMAPSAAADDGAAFTFSGPAERHALLRRFLVRTARGRPLILWLDDVQWGGDALAFARHLLRAQGRPAAPVLVLATVRDDLLPAGSQERGQIDALQGVVGVRSVAIEPLPAEHHRELVARLLGLRGDLVERVAERTSGNPLFAVQLVGDWVDRGVLEPTLDGFVVRQGEEAVLPESIQQVWAQRIDTAIARLPDGAREALQIAAALGTSPDQGEWEAACSEAGVPVDDRLVGRLASAGLVVPGRGGWSFAHGLLQESLAWEARAAGSWARWHAAALVALAPSTAEGIHGRRAGHQEVTDPQAAVGSWLRDAQESIFHADYAAADRALDRGWSMLVRLDAAPSDVRWGRVVDRRLTILRHQERPGEAQALAEQWLETARAHGWRWIEARLLAGLGEALQSLGHPDRAMESLRKAEALFLDLGDTDGALGCGRLRANTLRLRGELGPARALFEGLLTRLDRVEHPRIYADTCRDLAILEVADGHPGRAAERVAEARRIYDAQGFRMGVVRCANTQGTALMAAGRLEEAVACFTEGLELDRKASTGLAAMLTTNLALVQLRRGAFPAASAALARCREAVLASGSAPFELVFRAASLAASLGQRPIATWAEELARIVALLDRAGTPDPDVAWPLEIAARSAAGWGLTDAARTLWDLARAQWLALGDAEALQRVPQAT